MTGRYRVTAEFVHYGLDEYDSPREFVRTCLDGNRASHFARQIDILAVEEVEP